MRRYLFTFFLSCAALVVTSCQDNFLERAPENYISDTEFWKSTNDLKLYVNNFYTTQLPIYTGFNTMGIYGLDADLGSDNMIAMDYNTALNGERVVPVSGGGWAYDDWAGLRNINYFLNNYSKVPDTWENTKPYVGEALFFRSWFYFTKLQTFGDLPWINKPLEPSSPEINSGRLSRSVIVDSLMQDLDKAVQYLPTKSRAQASRINKEVAQLFQARIALYEGTWEKYHAGTPFGVAGSDGSKFLQKAVQVAEALVASPGGYALAPANATDGYWQLFNQGNYSSNPEIMLWRQYDINLNGGHYWHRYTPQGAGRGLTKDLVDAYLARDGKPIAVSPLYQGDNTLNQVVANRDPRLAQTIYVPDAQHIVTSNRPGGAAPVPFTVPTFNAATSNKPATGYQIYKGHNPDYNQQLDKGTTGLILFRFAEALLILAEAKAEMGAFTQTDADRTINLLRKRVGMPDLNVAAITPDPNWEFPKLSPLLNEIRRERRVELAGEGYRHDDLFRWAAADEKLVGWKPKGAKLSQWVGVVPASDLSGYSVDEKGYIELYKTNPAMASGYRFKLDRDYLAPLPTEQLVLNPDIKQNPGW